jgi:hypothetical protein
MSTSIAADAGLFEMLNGIPNVDISRNLEAAISAGRRMTSILREVVSPPARTREADPKRVFLLPALGSGPERGGEAPVRGQAGAAPDAPRLQRLRLVRRGVRQAALPNSDGGLNVPCAPFARCHTGGTASRGRAHPQKPSRNRAVPARAQIYPQFAKPVAGKYSLSVISAERYDAAADEVLLLGAERKTAESLACDLARGTGYVIQRRLDPDARLARLFVPRVWSVRALVPARTSHPVIHRAVAKIATGSNAADNFWRHGNMLGAIELETGIISRVVRGTGAEMSLNEAHPDTERPIVGTLIPR